MNQKTLDFTQSITIDSRLVRYDIWGSQAHAIMLARQQIISNHDLREILIWLQKAKTDLENGNFDLKPEHEDVHMNVETYLIDGAGLEFGGKLHTARSRNDQVLTDARLYAREEILRIESGLIKLCRVFLKIADQHAESVMPGYTHTQHAQPITLGFWATAYVSGFLRNLKLLRSTYQTVNQNPLGSCALAGTTFPINRDLTTELLGFDQMQSHALDVISSRDFIAETLFALSMIMTNLSRLSEEIIYWTTFEFGIATLDDQFSSGSSIMPQKKNADIAELTRGRSGKVFGALIDLLTNLKGLPMGYNRDLQEDKPPLWQGFDVVIGCLGVVPSMIDTITFHTDRMADLCDQNFATATELANYLVSDHDIPFRKCHEIVGSVVGDLAKNSKNFTDLDLTQTLLRKHEIDLPIEKLKKILDPKNAVINNKSLGGTSPKEVLRMSGEFSQMLSEIEKSIDDRWEKIETAYEKTTEIIRTICEL